MDRLRTLIDAQEGAVTRAQVLAVGVTESELRRMIRRRELVPVHRGVHVDRTGPLAWVTRAVAAVRFHHRSALCDVSALQWPRRSGEPGDVIHVAIEHPRSGSPLPSVRLHRVRNLTDRVHWHRTPPVLRIEQAALDVAGRSRDLAGAVALLAGVCQRGETTAPRLLAALEERKRTPRGRDLRRILKDVAGGTHSVLERDFLFRVVGPHGLPGGRRQACATSGARTVVRDVLLDDLGIVIELDGWQWHSTAKARAADLSRDLEAAAGGLITIRLGWSHVHQEACETAARLAAVMATRGWHGQARPCTSTCAVGRAGA